jgi:hypothetical protein
MNVCIFPATVLFADRSYMHNLWLKALQHEVLIISPVPQSAGSNTNDVERIALTYHCNRKEKRKRAKSVWLEEKYMAF